jgi:hypothetical protein
VESGFIHVNDALAKPEPKEQRRRRRRAQESEDSERQQADAPQDAKATLDLVA